MSNNSVNGRNMSGPGDLADVTLPANASSSREVDAGFAHDPDAQHKAAALFAYQMHGNYCKTCEVAGNELGLCHVGKQLYQKMRDVGVVS